MPDLTSPRPRGRTARPRVLVVDDDAALRAVVRVTLSTGGWDVLEASTPDEGVSRATREHPDVVLLDVVFPDETRDGFAACRELRSMKTMRGVPIVLFTAYDTPENRAFASAMGATAYLVKPFGPLDLLRMLRLVQGPSGGQPGVGLYLLDAGAITPEQLERGLAEQRLRQGEKVHLGEILVELGFTSTEAVQLALARQTRARQTPSAPHLAVELRVVIADDHPGVREGLRDAITAERGLTVIGVASDGDEALRQIRALRPDLVVLDQDMPNRTGIEVLRIIRKELPNIGVVLFTLDDSIRASALGGGAASVVTKDSPVSLLIAELRRAGEARLRGSPAEVGAVFAVRSAARRAWGVVLRQQRTLTAMGVLAVAYAAAFLIVEPALGASAAILGLVPVALAGALVGPEAGILAAVVTAALNLALWQSTGHPIGEPFLTVGGNGVGFLALIGIGAGFGGMRTLRGSFDRSARRATALADAAIVLATSEGPETLHLLAAGALDVVPGEVALLFLPVPGGGIELVAAQGTPSGIVGARPSGDAITRAYTHGTASIVDAVVASIGVDLPHMRSAVVAPVAGVGPSPAGVVVVLSPRRGVYGEVHLQALEAYGVFVGMAIATRFQTAEGRESRARTEPTP